MSYQLLPPIQSLLLLGTGVRVGREEREPEVITLPTRSIFHTFSCGKSGYGKSRFLCGLALTMLSRNVPYFLIDPAGDLARLLLQLHIKLGWYSGRKDPFSKLVFLDINAARKKGLYLSYNALQTGYDPHTTAHMVVEAFKRAFPALKGGVMVNVELLLTFSSYVLAANELPLFPYMYYLLSDNTFRARLLCSPAITDSLLIHFFRQHTDPKSGELTIGADPTIKRLLLLCFAPELRYSFGQSRNVLDFPSFLAQGTSVILNLHSPDPEMTRLFGSFVTTAIELAAKARGEIPAEERRGTHALLIDEFQMFSAQSGDSFTHILDECRKYGLYLVLSTQSYKRIPEDIRSALSNTELRIAYRLEEEDAAAVAPLLHFSFNPYLEKQSYTRTPKFYTEAEQRRQHIRAITQLAKREAFVKLPDDRLYRMQTLTVNDPYIDPKMLTRIEEEYFRRYFCSQVTVEAEITKHLQTFGVIPTPIPQSATIKSYDTITTDHITNGEDDAEELDYDDF